MTSPELASAAPATLLVPLGAVEQHGPHLPLVTDIIVAVAWAERVAAALSERGESVAVAPALPYGSSGEHQAFPGTLSIGREALELVVVELVRSASSAFDRVVLLSGHAGNLQPVTGAANRLRADGHRVVDLVPTWPGAEAPIDAHAGRTETSLLLFLRPELVRVELIAPGDPRPLEELWPSLVTGGVAAVSPTGVLGDPTHASAEEGRRLMGSLVERTVALLADPAATPRSQYDNDTGR